MWIGPIYVDICGYIWRYRDIYVAIYVDVCGYMCMDRPMCGYMGIMGICVDIWGYMWIYI